MMTLGVEDQLHGQADVCTAMGSALCGALLHAAADDYCDRGTVRRFFDADPNRIELSRIGIRLLGALHYCALEGTARSLASHLPSCGGDGDAIEAWTAAVDVLDIQAERIGTLFERTPQTNEVARSMPLLAGLLAIARATHLPIRLLDIGASAGLNARCDRYRYEGQGWAWGDPTSPLVLRNRSRGGIPAALDAPLRVSERLACDLHPLDIGVDRDRLELRSFVWADQLERFERLNSAIMAANAVPLAVDAADMYAWIPIHARPFDGHATVAMHSIVTEHITPEMRQSLKATIEKAGANARPSAPFAWVRMEPDSSEQGRYETRATLMPSGEEWLIARSDGHGQDLEWI